MWWAAAATLCPSLWPRSPPGSLGPDPISDRALANVASANGLTVAVGSNGLLLTSRDGRTFTPRNSSVGVNLRGAAFGNGVWIAVGDASTIVRSVDGGVTWTPTRVPVASAFRAATFGQGLFVVAGAGGVIVTSSDGATWTRAVSGTDNILWGATVFARGLFIVSGQFGTLLTRPGPPANRASTTSCGKWPRVLPAWWLWATRGPSPVPQMASPGRPDLRPPARCCEA